MVSVVLDLYAHLGYVFKFFEERIYSLSVESEATEKSQTQNFKRSHLSFFFSRAQVQAKGEKIFEAISNYTTDVPVFQAPLYKRMIQEMV